MNVVITLFIGFLIGVIMRDVKNRFGIETFWIGMGIVIGLSLGGGNYLPRHPMTYGVKSKLYKRYLKEFDNYSDARVFCLKQQKVWTNATMQIYEIIGLQADKLLEEFPPTKPTKYMKIKKKDIRGNYKVKVDPKKIAPKDDEFYGESEAEAQFRLQKEADNIASVFKPIEPKPLTWWERFLWWITPTKTFVSWDAGIPDGDHTVIMKFKKRGGKIFITEMD
jgi:hypothetical protein